MYFKYKLNIIIFDSGLGGLLFYNQIKRIIPYSNYFYVFDNIGFPYGNKDQKYIINRIIKIINNICTLNKIDLIIIACNTASILTLPKLRKLLNYPIIGVLPAIKTATEFTNNNHICLLATNNTIYSKYINSIVNKLSYKYKITLVPTMQLVYLAENLLQGYHLSILPLYKIITTVWKNNNKKTPDTIVLGCTHFSLFTLNLLNILDKKITVIDSNIITINFILMFIKNNINYNKNNKFRYDKAYCVSLNKKTKNLAIILKYYGFKSLETINLDKSLV
ncbi:MAG: glutamate racemase [Candidatus Lightella neohaematopini]|nr:glutamate racemase [Candidatus Lightella neohaematopini]MCV2528856.1 glutamate racemase [Candidatus Lightella neohaematopini]